MSPPAPPRHQALPPDTPGWFQIGWSDQLKRGAVREIAQFGLKLVLFRGEDGQVGVLDATCPHLGANLARGGVVRGGAVVCPYHHWAFDRQGICTDIPHALKIPPNAKTRCWPVAEYHGLIFVYRSGDGSPPTRPLPEIEDFNPVEWCKPSTFDREVRVHGQDIVENSVDSAHFVAVHGHKMPVNTFTSLGTEMRVSQATQMKMYGFNVRSVLEFHMIEPGFHFMRVKDAPGTQTLVLSSIVPIDGERVNHRLTLWVKKTKIPGWSWLLKKVLIKYMISTYLQDMEIWQNKVYLPRPVLCSYDTAIVKIRNWYGQFYETAVEGIGDHQAPSDPLRAVAIAPSRS